MQTLTPDGRWLAIDGNNHGVTGPWAYMIWVHGQRHSFRVHSSTRGSAETIARQSRRGESIITREASLGRHRLLSQEDREMGGTTLVWQGDFHELSTYVHGLDVPLELLVDRLKLLDLTDGRDGLVVRAARGTGVKVSHTLGANFIANLCGITVRPAESAPELPRALGHTVRGGRVWRDDYHDEEGTLTRRLVLIANESAVTTLSPFDPHDARLRPLVESIDARLG